MLPDLAKLSEDELIELNRRIVERLQLLRSAKSLAQLAQFSVGMVVEFDTDDGRTISGTIARLNQRTATVVTASGRWRVILDSCEPRRCRRPADRGLGQFRHNLQHARGDRYARIAIQPEAGFLIQGDYSTTAG